MTSNFSEFSDQKNGFYSIFIRKVILRKGSSIEEEYPNQISQKTISFYEIVDQIKAKNIKTINLEPYKASLSLPIEKLLETEEIVAIYEKLIKKNRQSKKNWSYNENHLLVWLVLNYCLIRDFNPLSIPEDELCQVLSLFPGKTFEQTKFKWFSLKKFPLYSTPWTKEEDEILKKLIMEKGSNKWNEISKEMNRISGSKIFRLGKQCRERWNNHLDPNLNRGPWTKEEDLQLLNSILEIGKKWSDIAKRLAGRTENSVKNRFISLINKEKSLLTPSENDKYDMPNDNSIDSQTSDDIEENSIVKSLILQLEKELDIAETSNKRRESKTNVKIKKNLLMDLINQEKKTKEEEESDNSMTQINSLKIFTPILDNKNTNHKSMQNIKEDNLDTFLNKSFLNESRATAPNNKILGSNLNTPAPINDSQTTKSTNNCNNLQELLKKDFSNFFLGGQNPLVTLIHGIQLIRFSLFMFQKDVTKLLDTKNLNPTDKKIVALKDFSNLLYENNFQDIQLSFLNPVKNEVFLLNPMNETELSQMELSVEAQNVFMNMSKFNQDFSNINLSNSSFLPMQNFSPFNLNHSLLNANFTPIISRTTGPNFNPLAANFMNANNFMRFNQMGSNFNSPAINLNMMPPHSDFFFSKLMENMNNPNKNLEQNSSLNNNNNNYNYNNTGQQTNNNNELNVKMEIDQEQNSFANKRN